MTQTANVTAFKLGDKVFNNQFDNFERTGEIVDKNGALMVYTVLPENNKPYTLKISDKWQLFPENGPANILNSILESADKKPAPAPVEVQAAPEKIETAPAFEPLSETEIETRKKLISEYKRADQNEQNAYLRKCEIIHEIRTLKLFRGDYPTFAEFALNEFQVTREYAQNLAQIGAFYAVSKDFIKGNKLSVNSINQLVRNQNKLAETLQMSGAELSDFAPVIEKVLQTTIEASKNEKGKVNITPKIVDTVANEIKTQIGEMKSEKTGAELIELAAKMLGQNSATILTKTRERLADTVKKPKTQSAAPETPANDECIHSLTVKFIDENNLLTLECGCQFKMVIK